MFNHSHYDWWAFPIDKSSQAYQDQYRLYADDIVELRADGQFMNALRSNAVMVCEGWGWDLENGVFIANVDKDQHWGEWPIRLSKMCRSLQIFGEDNLCKNAVLYGIILLEYYKQFAYGGQFLSEYFRKKFS